MVDTIGNSTLFITDGNDRISLFDIGFCDWIPQTAPWKDGGIFSDSPFSDKTALIARQFTSIVDTFILEPSFLSQDAVIGQLLKLQKMLEKAIAYQVSRWQNEPVWIEAQGEQETNKRYALIIAYQMPQLDNPFQAPFTTPDVENVAIEDFTLVINHEIWQSESPGQGHCVLGNSIQLMGSLTSTHLAVPITSMYDAATYYKSEDTDIVPPYAGGGLVIGRYAFIFNNILVFRNVQLNHLDHIVTAHIDFMASQNSPAGNELVKFTGLKNREDYAIMPNLLTPEEIGKLPRTNVSVNVTIAGAWVAGTTYQVLGLGPIIQEIINDPEWEIGQDICLIMEDNGTAVTQAEKFAWSLSTTPLAPGADPPYLHIDSYYPADCEMGQEDTCLDNVFLANKQNRAQITDIMVYDADGDYIPNHWSHWESCLDPLPHHLWPDVPDVIDRLFVGIRTSAIQSGPFSNIIFDLNFPYADMPTFISGMTYLYYDKVAAAWVVLPVGTYYDETQMFNVAGVHGFFFLQPANMWHVIINGIDAYWICFEITAISGAGPRMADQVNRPVYTVNTAYFDISESSAGGDIPAIAKSRIFPKNFGSLAIYQSFYLAVRSIARGMDFSPYLNCTSAIDQIPGLVSSIRVGSLISSFIADNAGLFIGSPTGFVGLYNPAAPTGFTQEFIWSFDDTLAAQYSGKYAFYLRYRSTSAVDPDFSVKLKFSWGGMVNVFTEEVAIPPIQHDSVYLGTYDITLSAKKGERFTEYDISLYIKAVNGAGGDLYIFDLVLVPVDEIPILVKVPLPGWWVLNVHPEKTGVVIDSVDYPKDLVRVFYFNNNTDDLSAAIEYYLSGIWMQQTGHQRIWYFAFGSGNMRGMHCCVSMQQFATNRYALGMRGTQ